jgi:hypothetical protein
MGKNINWLNTAAQIRKARLKTNVEKFRDITMRCGNIATAY